MKQTMKRTKNSRQNNKRNNKRGFPLGKGKCGHKTKSQKFSAEIRQAQAVRLRRQGYTYEQIARLLEVTIGTVSKDIKNYLTQLRKDSREDALDIRDMELQRIDDLYRTIMLSIEKHLNPDPVEKRDKDGKLVSVLHPKIDYTKVSGLVDKAVNVMERRSKLLGLDAPEKLQLGGDQEHPLAIEFVNSLDEFKSKFPLPTEEQTNDGTE